MRVKGKIEAKISDQLYIVQYLQQSNSKETKIDRRRKT